MSLFNQKLCRERIARFDFPTGEKAAQIEKIISGWQRSLKDSDLSKTKEKSIQGQFLIKFFEDILGYTSQVSGKDEWSLIQHPQSEVDAQEPDGSLGFFTRVEKITKAVIELKDAKTPLDKKQTGREKGYTPIEQAYLYATKFDRCNWIIVSNFREIRLYHKSRTQDFYEKFEVLELHKPEEFKRFYYLLCKQNLISRSKTSIIDDLANDSTKEEEDITLKFYSDYKNARLSLFYHLAEQNPEVEKTLLLEKAQKIIDRLIFVMFCEDTGNLLPRNIVQDTYNLGIRSRERSDRRVWREFKNLFMDIDVGRSDIDPEINRYNGGLFAQDDVLNNLVIKDTIWKQLVSLNKYDFESELNVNILGHIFEQSISDIESFKAELLGKETEKDISRRKKEGIFYTPEFITKYLIENVVGRFLADHPDKLETVKILDPACGSGAFLNQAHTYLMNEYRTRTEQKLLQKTGKGGVHQLDFSDINLAESNRAILLNNLFGVDLNQESVEITKLSLWLKTARASEPLQNLDKNIRCGNSIVDDPMYAGAKAFNWQNEFKDILSDGGFDVIIGNPPYVRQELIKDIKPYLEKQYRVYTGVSDLYVYFFEKAMSLLKENGYFAFIVSNKFLRAGYGQKLTQYLQQNFTILNLIDFGDLQIFEGATTYPCIITLQKKKPADIQRASLLKLTSLEKASSLALEVKENSQTIEIKKDDDTWQLRSIEENNLLKKLKKDTVSLGDFTDNQILRGIVTGFNDAFIIDDLTRERLCKEDASSTEIIKPVLRGKDINRYRSSWEHLWIIFTRRGIDISKYPAIHSYLKQFQNNLEPGIGRKPGTYKWYEVQDNIAYFREFQKPKIIWGNLATSASFSFDADGYYICAPACILPTEHKWLLALLNSSVSTFFLRKTAIERQGGFIEQKPVYVNQIPIPNVNDDVRSVLTDKVEMLLKLNLEKQELNKQALEVLRTECRLLKVTQKLENFLRLGWNELIEELEKQKIKLDLTQKDKLNVWFRSKQKTATNLNQSIEKLDREIDMCVYRLYNLSESEIKIIEKDNNN
jgi:type I restriction-modification system DNA methylase subunit